MMTSVSFEAGALSSSNSTNDRFSITAPCRWSLVYPVCSSQVTGKGGNWRIKPPDAESAACPAFLAGLGPLTRNCGGTPSLVRCTRCWLRFGATHCLAFFNHSNLTFVQIEADVKESA